VAKEHAHTYNVLVCNKLQNYKQMKPLTIRFPVFSLAVLLSLSVISCGNSVKNNRQKQAGSVVDTTRFIPGTLYDTVSCVMHPGESYALLLPRNYTPQQHFPVIFFFDAHARGWLPVRRYQSLALQYGYIMVASNNSQNGLSAQKRNQIIYDFMQDVEQRFSIDPQRIYTGGFSGGARIAAGIGLSNPSIAGTIGCAAGFPSLGHVANKNLAYVGIVGNEDFNYLEMRRLSSELTAAGWHHCLLIFNGHHQWPPLAVMNKALLFLQADAMRRHFIPKDTATLHAIKTLFTEEKKSAMRRHDVLEQLHLDRQAIAFLNGLSSIAPYQQEEAKLLQTSQLKKQREQQVILKKEEEKWQQLYARALENRNSAWWKTTLRQLSGMKKSADTPEKRQMVRRLYNYLSLMAYLYADGSLKNGRMEAAAKYLMIYRFVDPKNPEVYFLKAKYFALTGEKEAVLPALQKAADHGFYDLKRLENNSLFTSFYQNSVFKKILQQVKNNPVKAE
jgi:predicted esterase